MTISLWDNYYELLPCATTHKIRLFIVRGSPQTDWLNAHSGEAHAGTKKVIWLELESPR